MRVDLDTYRDAIEAELRDIVRTDEEAASRLFGMLQYHMGWVDAAFHPEEAPKGKRLRPVMCLLACEAVGGAWRGAVPAAAAIELIHNFSLIHDDIEDNSDTRRHRATLWRLWGLAHGINSGDALWAIARTAVYRLSDHGYPPEIVLGAARRLDETCVELCIGQYLDLAFAERQTVTLAEYERMIAGKTAALLSASVGLGAMVGGAPPEIVAAYDAFGRDFGLAFQVVDDVLGIWGDPTMTGKPAASDLLERKKTLPIAYAMAWERARGQDELARVYSLPEWDVATIERILSLLDAAEARTYAERRAAELHQRALRHLDSLGIESPAQEMLRELAASLLDRNA